MGADGIGHAPRHLKSVPHLWRYADMRPKLLTASTLITAEEAERRVLMLENPALRGSSFIANTLFAGLQIILPGEIARSHRHSPNALRFIMEGEGGYTMVGGERADLHAGDFAVTPNWSWHSHGNEGNGPVIWMDGLDTPFDARFFGAAFRENFNALENAPARASGSSLAEFGSNLLPVDYKGGTLASPIVVYPYERTRAALAHAAKSAAPHPAQGFKLRYANPATGLHPFPTMAVAMQLLPKGFTGRVYRSTENVVFAVVEGEGQVRVSGNRDDEVLRLPAPHDVFFRAAVVERLCLPRRNRHGFIQLIPTAPPRK